MEKMTNEQAALMAAVKTYGDGSPNGPMVTRLADYYLNWLRNKERE